MLACLRVCLFAGVLTTLGVTLTLPKGLNTQLCQMKFEEGIIDLSSIYNTDYSPRYSVKDNEGWLYTFNPCRAFNLPNDPHTGNGDQCPYVAMCKSKANEYFTLGWFSDSEVSEEKITLDVTVENEKINENKTSNNEAVKLPKSEPILKDNPESKPIGKAGAESEIKAESKAEAESEIKPEGEAEGEAEGKAEAESEIKAEGEAEGVVKGKPESASIITSIGSDNNTDSEVSVNVPEVKVNVDSETHISFVLHGKRSLVYTTTVVRLECDIDNTGEAKFTLSNDTRDGDKVFVLSHKCCCFNGCYVEDVVRKHQKPRVLWILIIGVSFVMGVAISLCHFCGHSSSSAAESPYTFLPALQGGRSLGGHIETFIPSSIAAKLSLDPTSTAGKTSHTPSFMNLPEEPVVSMSSTTISQSDISFKQRLGGGAFCDTYLAEHKGNRIAAKRITVGIHKGQITQSQVNWMKDEIKMLIKQKHTNLIQILGVCLDTREPYVLTEFSPANAFKDLLNIARYPNRTFLQNLDICMQTAEGLNYLHSSKPPILHRDLRASNILVTAEGKAKVVDFGHTRLVQQFRMDCVKEKCFCNKAWGALPASLRWTAPEILEQPMAIESNSSTIFTPAVDIYSYGMVLYEAATASLPFDDVIDEKKVMELVLNGDRPSTQSVITISQYIDIMTECWNQLAVDRPTFKTIMMQLNSVANSMKNMSSAKRRLVEAQNVQFKTALSMKSIASTK